MPPLTPPTTEQECLAGAREALHAWARTIAGLDVDQVLALYAPDAILVPTLSNQVRDCDPSRRGYFETFLGCDALHCEVLAFNKRVSRKLGTVVVGGLYRFHITRGGVTEAVPARFLFTFEFIEGRWLITGHHSSTEV